MAGKTLAVGVVGPSNIVMCTTVQIFWGQGYTSEGGPYLLRTTGP